MGAVSEADARSTRAPFSKESARRTTALGTAADERFRECGIGCRSNRAHPAAPPKAVTRSFPG
ncbi:MAG: hypothetical protein Kow0092_38560 [Deferrisomatales bacterium]